MSYQHLGLILAVLTCAAPAQSPSSASASEASRHLAKAQEFLQQRQPALAIPELEAVVGLEPDNFDAQVNLGVLYYFGHNDAKALPHLRTAIQAKPDLWKLRALLGLTEMHLHDVDAGRADLSAALPHLKGEKVQREAGDVLIASYSATGELDKAAQTVSVLLDADPANPALLLTSYRLYSELANNAIVTLALAGPDSAEIHIAMAHELVRHGDDDAAITNYREAIRLDPKSSEAHLELGMVYFNSMDLKLQAEAAAEFQAALVLNPKDEKAQLMLGEDAARKGDSKAAYDSESRAVQLNPDDPDACTELAKTLIDMGEMDKARSLLDHAVALDPTNETAHYRLALLERKRGNTAKSKEELAEFKKYKEMKSKLHGIFREMRVKINEQRADDLESDAKSSK
jgi:Tfp pilus assembly protein PilF